jgi:hypothetical protein
MKLLLNKHTWESLGYEAIRMIMGLLTLWVQAKTAEQKLHSAACFLPQFNAALRNFIALLGKKSYFNGMCFSRNTREYEII